ncbi:hypothetical protein E4U56_002481 [Claviceps arundinis]|uniref:Retroviral polymerase SH3-like domain-containing protein n=1 Tax=Claviceps arundinis TaxID=1623583 RepID=A0A9P7SM84_9HYPO|nr:hypothetical protein E4U56_002481 [Claviceps arundinis]
MAPRAKVGRLVGMDGPKCRLYEIWLPDEERIVRARDVKFDEGDSPTDLSPPESPYIAELVDPSFEEEGRRITDIPNAEVFAVRPPPTLKHRGGISPSNEHYTDKLVISEASKPPFSSALPPTHFLPSPSPTPSTHSGVHHRRILRNDSILPGSFLDDDENFSDEPIGNEPNVSEDEDPSAQLMREASQPRRSQRSVPRQDYLHIATAGKKRARSPNRSNVAITYFDDDFSDDADQDAMSYSFLLLEAANVSDTKIDIPRRVITRLYTFYYG